MLKKVIAKIDEQECKTPGRKIRSRGKGRGLGIGKGRGPIGRRATSEDLLSGDDKLFEGAYMPDLKSSAKAGVILRKDDFKDQGVWDSIIEQLRFNDVLKKKKKEYGDTDEPDSSIDDYDQVIVYIHGGEMS